MQAWVGYFHAPEPCHNVCLPTTMLDAIYPIMLINVNYLTAPITESEIRSAFHFCICMNTILFHCLGALAA